MMNLDATIYFLVKRVTSIRKEEAEKVKLGSFPSPKDVKDQATKAGVELPVSAQSTQLLGLSQGGFMPDAKVAGAAMLNDLALDADIIICF